MNWRTKRKTFMNALLSAIIKNTTTRHGKGKNAIGSLVQHVLNATQRRHPQRRHPQRPRLQQRHPRQRQSLLKSQPQRLIARIGRQFHAQVALRGCGQLLGPPPPQWLPTRQVYCTRSLVVARKTELVGEKKNPTAMDNCNTEWYHLGDKYGGYTGNCGGHQYSDLYQLTFEDPCNGNPPSHNQCSHTCSNWVPVSCTSGTSWLWSSDRAYTTATSADSACTLYTLDGGCTKDGTGWRCSTPSTMSRDACYSDWYHVGDKYGGYTGNCGGHQYSSLYQLTYENPSSSCGSWTPVTCTTSTSWLWSSSRSYTSVAAADAGGTLYTVAGGCTQDGGGWRSHTQSTMNNCNSEWYHVGVNGGYTGNCGGHFYSDLYRLTYNNPC